MSNSWDAYPNELKRFGWTIDQQRGQDVLIVPTIDGDGLWARTKVRGGRQEDGSLLTYWIPAAPGKSDKQGLAGDSFGLDTIDPDRDIVILTGSETDALALARATENENIPARILCSCSETRSLAGVLSGPWYRGLSWLVIGDNDETGRKHAPRRVLEIANQSGHIGVMGAFPPKGTKDARQFLEGGGLLDDLIGLAKPLVRKVIEPVGKIQQESRPTAPRKTQEAQATEKGEAYARAVLDGELSTLGSSQAGGRESALIKSAFIVGKKCLHAIDFETAFSSLVSVARSIGLPDKEAREKARRGLQKGQMEADVR